MPFDILTGSARTREAIDGGDPDLDTLCASDEEQWREDVASFLLYE